MVKKIPQKRYIAAVEAAVGRLDITKLAALRRSKWTRPRADSLEALIELAITNTGPAGTEAITSLFDLAEERDIDAIRVLGHNRFERSLVVLLGILEDHSGGCRAAAAALGELRDLRAVEPLIAVLNDSTRDRWIRAAAGLALGQLRSRLAEPHLRRAIAEELDGSDHWYRTSLIEALLRLAGISPFRWLFAARWKARTYFLRRKFLSAKYLTPMERLFNVIRFLALRLRTFPRVKVAVIKFGCPWEESCRHTFHLRVPRYLGNADSWGPIECKCAAHSYKFEVLVEPKRLTCGQRNGRLSDLKGGPPWLGMCISNCPFCKADFAWYRKWYSGEYNEEVESCRNCGAKHFSNSGGLIGCDRDAWTSADGTPIVPPLR